MLLADLHESEGGSVLPWATMLQFLGGRALQWTARSPHGMTWKVRRPWWPPFFTTDLWPPRVRMWFTNEGEDLVHDIGFQLDVVEYDGRIGELPRATGWTDTTHVSLNEPRWLSGETRRFMLKAKGRELPHPGNYAMRLSVAKFTPIPGAPRASPKAMRSSRATSSPASGSVRTPILAEQ